MTGEEISALSDKKAFIIFINKMILVQGNCCPFTGLVKEIANIYQIYCVKGEIDDNKKMPSFTLRNFQENLQLTPGHKISRNPIIVHSKNVNPVV